MNNKYDDIINLDRPISKRLPMSMEARSAQFAPFAALVGYEDQVKETSRLVDSMIILNDDKKDLLNNKLTFLNNNLNLVDVRIKFYKKDSKKDGYNYFEIIGKIKKIDMIHRKIKFDNNKIIDIDSIIDIYFI